jgi:sugar/nucleoside kinase (ribokinase family)
MSPRGARCADRLLKFANGSCLVAHEDGVSVVRPVPVPVVDTTGAGDAFASTLAVALMM